MLPSHHAAATLVVHISHHLPVAARHEADEGTALRRELDACVCEQTTQVKSDGNVKAL